jgi:hypothetical protein
MKYEKYSYLYPPRPENAVPGDMLNLYEERNWHAQAKKNGTCNVMAISPEREITAMTRHRTPHKAWSANADTKKAFQNLPGNGWYVFVCELMHSKVHGIRNINYINDILVADGEYLVGSTFASRQSLFHGLFKSVGETDTHWIIDASTWVAKGRTSGFQEWFNSMSPEASGNHENEGLVLKDPKARLAFCSKEKANVSWLVKSRHPTTLQAF